MISNITGTVLNAAQKPYRTDKKEPSKKNPFLSINQQMFK